MTHTALWRRPCVRTRNAWWHFEFRAGLKVYHIINHYNPGDVRQHDGSDDFGVFYNSVGRLHRVKGVFDF